MQYLMGRRRLPAASRTPFSTHSLVKEGNLQMNRLMYRVNTTPLPVQIEARHYTMPKLDVYVPVVTGGQTPPAALGAMNRQISGNVRMLLQEQGYGTNPLTDTTGSFEIKTNQRHVLSLSLINYAYSGGAHGNTLIRSLTFDTATGKSYSLRELFKPGSNYVERLSAHVAAQIKSRGIPVLYDFKSIRPDQDYYIADKALVLYFQLYELTPYVYGFPYFPISVYAIQDIVDEQGPLGRMLS